MDNILYIMKFQKYADAIKIGITRDFNRRARELQNDYGDIVSIRYMNFSDDREACKTMERIIHSSFLTEDIIKSIKKDDNFLYEICNNKNGYTEFFKEKAVIERIAWLESLAFSWGVDLKNGKLSKKKYTRFIEDISLKELYELDVNHKIWHIENIHWGDFQKKSGNLFEEDMNINNNLKDKRNFDLFICEKIREEKELSSFFIENLDFANKYLNCKENIKKQVEFINAHRYIQILTKTFPKIDFNLLFEYGLYVDEDDNLITIDDFPCFFSSINIDLLNEIMEKNIPILEFENLPNEAFL